MAAGLPSPGPCREGSGSAVSDLDDQISELRKGGIEPGEPVKSPKVDIVMIKDPDGNSIASAQTLEGTMGQ